MALIEHVERRLEVGAVGTRRNPVRHQRRLGDVVAGFARGLALRKFEMHRARRRRGRRAHGAAHLLAHGLGVDDGAPLHDRLVDRLLVDALAQAGLEGRARIGVGDRDQRRAIEESVRHAVDHVGRTGPARGEAYSGAAGEVAPGRGQHRAGDFLLHQEKPHLSLACRFHQFHRFTAGMADDEGRAGVPERGGEHFDSGGHGKSLPNIFFCCRHHGRTCRGFQPRAAAMPIAISLSSITILIRCLRPISFSPRTRFIRARVDQHR